MDQSTGVHIIVPQGMTGVFTRGDRTGESVFVQCYIHLRLRPCRHFWDYPLCDHVERVRILFGDLQTELRPGFGLIDALQFSPERAPVRERLTLQHHLWCIDGPRALARRNLTLALGKNRLRKTVGPAEFIPVINVQPQRYHAVEREALG